MVGIDYVVDEIPSGEIEGKCPRCRRVVMMNTHIIRMVALGQGSAAGKVYACRVCWVRLTDTGVFGRGLRFFLLASFLLGLGFWVSVFAPMARGMFESPSEVGAELWLVTLALTAAIAGAAWVIARSMRRLFISRFVETRGAEAGL